MAGQTCPLCEQRIEPGQHVAFQHGTLLHLHCYSLERLAKKPGRPEVRCAICRKPVQADANTVFGADSRVTHKQCPETTDTSVRPISGGLHDSPWTVMFDRRLAARLGADRTAFAEFMAASPDAVSHARAVRAGAVRARARRAHARCRLVRAR